MRAIDILRGALGAVLAIGLALAVPLTHSNPTMKPGVIRLGRRRVSAQTGDYTVTAAETGTLFSIEGASSEVVFTLPALASGLEYWFYAAELENLVLSAADADTLIVYNDIAADQIAFNTTNEQGGGEFRVICDGSKWFVAESGGHEGQLTVIAT